MHSDPTQAVYGDDITGSATAGPDPQRLPDPCELAEHCREATDTILGLPMTGLDLLLLAGVAFVLMATGFALRRAATPR